MSVDKLTPDKGRNLSIWTFKIVSKKWILLRKKLCQFIHNWSRDIEGKANSVTEKIEKEIVSCFYTSDSEIRKKVNSVLKKIRKKYYFVQKWYNTTREKLNSYRKFQFIHTYVIDKTNPVTEKYHLYIHKW